MNPSPSPPSVSVWQLKPWWCQPWSILLTGIVLIGGSWLLLHRLWVTLLVAIPVLIWMGFFLGLYPQLYAQQMAVSQPLEVFQHPVDAPSDEITPNGTPPDNQYGA
jgi:hypothetical protein